MKDLSFKVHLSFNDKDTRQKIESLLKKYGESIAEINPNDSSALVCNYKDLLTEAYVYEIIKLAKITIVEGDDDCD